VGTHRLDQELKIGESPYPISTAMRSIYIMPSPRPTSLDLSVVARRISAIRAENQLTDNAKALAHLVLGNRHDLTSADINDLITDGSDDRGIDAIFIDDREGASCIRLYQFKYHESEKAFEKNFPSSETDKILSFLNDLFDRNTDLEKSCNPLLWQKILQIWQTYENYKNGHPNLEIHFISNGLPLTQLQLDRIKSSLSKYNFVTFHETSFSDLMDLLVGRKRRAQSYKLKVVDKQLFERSDGNIRGVVATIEAETLLSVISSNENKTVINHELFDDNIRVYLGNDNPVNGDIINSALSDENSLFWYLNNGVTIICDSFRYPTNLRSPTIEVDNLQIVNGAQTSYALFEAFNRNPEAIQNVLVLVKLFETRINGLAHKVAIATNSQTRIQNRDLMSNHIVQKKIESAFSSLGFFYERKKNQHTDKPIHQRVDALRLGQVILAFHLRLPERARTDSDKIFGNLYDEIFSSQHDAEYLLFMYKIHIKIERLREQVIQRGRENKFYLVGEPNNTFLIYGQYHILFLVAVLLDKRSVKNPSDEKLESIIDESISIVRDIVGSKTEISFYNYFRNPRTKDRLYQNAWIQQLSLFGE
jgi:hypothetical protein